MSNTYTRQRPTEPGYYWVKCSKRRVKPEIVFVAHTHPGLEICFIDTYGFRYEEEIEGYEWCGPIQPPEEKHDA